MGKIVVKVIDNQIHSIEGHDTQVEVHDDGKIVHMNFKKQEYNYEERKIMDPSRYPFDQNDNNGKELQK
jgi:hypothetical protein|tara:strand:+ start:2715 stop:2921 length:207 start_codon:yes stop_codon:yes gene_type:complete